MADPKRLPLNGDYRYEPPSGTKPQRSKGGGFKDRKNNVWIWCHGIGPGLCEHWDVEHPDGNHSNISPNGTKHHRYVSKEHFP